MIYWIWVLIIGALIGIVAGLITGRGGSMGFFTNILAGLIGSSLGQAIFGEWGPQMAGMAIVPSILGAVILVLLTSFILRIFGRRTE